MNWLLLFTLIVGVVVGAAGAYHLRLAAAEIAERKAAEKSKEDWLEIVRLRAQVARLVGREPEAPLASCESNATPTLKTA